MAWAAGGTQHRFDFPREKVWVAAVSTVIRLGASVKSVNESLGRIVIGTGMSLFSYGENVTIAVQASDADATVVSLGSQLKMGTNFMGGGRHEKNFEAILSGIDTELQKSGAWRMHEGNWWTKDVEGRDLWFDKRSGQWVIYQPQ